MANLESLQEKYGLSEAEALYVSNQSDEKAAVDFVKSERIGPAAEGVEQHVPGGQVPPQPTEAKLPDGICPTCGQPLPDERPTGLTAAEYDRLVGPGGATVAQLQAAASAAEEEEAKPAKGSAEKASIKKAAEK